MFYLIGLGNPGAEYKESRHNAGQIAVEYFKSKINPSEASKIKIIESGEFMNNSGRAVAKFIKSKKAAQSLIVVYDDIDLPLGSIKISYNKNSGGHRGLESIIKTLKTKEFTRLRIGIAPTTPSGKIKKPGLNLPGKESQKAVLNFILGKFKPKEIEIVKKSNEAIFSLLKYGRDKAMNLYN